MKTRDSRCAIPPKQKRATQTFDHLEKLRSTIRKGGETLATSTGLSRFLVSNEELEKNYPFGSYGKRRVLTTRPIGYDRIMSGICVMLQTLNA